MYPITANVSLASNVSYICKCILYLQMYPISPSVSISVLCRCIRIYDSGPGRHLVQGYLEMSHLYQGYQEKVQDEGSY